MKIEQPVIRRLFKILIISITMPSAILIAIYVLLALIPYWVATGKDYWMEKGDWFIDKFNLIWPTE